MFKRKSENLTLGFAATGNSSKKPTKNLAKKKDLIFVYVGLAWSVLHFLVFWGYVNIGTIVSSFQTEDILGKQSFAGWNNYLNIFKTIAGKSETGILTHYAFTNVVWLLFLGVFINAPITLVFSYMIFRNCKGAKIYRVLLYLPAVISPIVLCLAFKGMIDSRTGFICEILRAWHLEDSIPASGFLGSEKTAWTSILIFSVWTGISGNLIYFISAMSRVPDSLIESAALDGANDACIFFKIVVPLIWSTITTICVQVIGTTFSWYIPSMSLTGGGPNGTTSTIGLIIIMNTSSTTGNMYGYVSALSVLVGVFGTLLVLVFRGIMERFFKEVEY